VKLTGKHYRDACTAWQEYIVLLKCPEATDEFEEILRHKKMRAALSQLRLACARQRRYDFVKRRISSKKER
jgi:hypothetical protein